MRQERLIYQRNWYIQNRERLLIAKKAYREANKERIRKTLKTYYIKNADYLRTYAKERNKLHREEKRLYDVRHKYGITSLEYHSLLEKQKNVCAICEKASHRRALDIDHDHTTGKVRGLLCHLCNRGLGYFRDSPGYLSAAITYLERC